MRPSLDQYFVRMARLASTRSTCLRRAVGCVLVDDRGHVLSTGYNGVASGQPHCNYEGGSLPHVRELRPGWLTNYEYPHACAGATQPSGQGLDLCEAVHAEQNALLQCPDVYRIATCYCTTFPCVTCVKLLLNTACRRIVYAEEYSQPQAHELWVRNQRASNQLEEA